jgi:NMD protein affecting ribosome stability and mRNA decay
MPMRLNKIGEKNMEKCKRCGKEISEQDSESYDGLCWECWDDQLTEESDSMFDELM